MPLPGRYGPPPVPPPWPSPMPEPCPSPIPVPAPVPTPPLSPGPWLSAVRGRRLHHAGTVLVFRGRLDDGRLHRRQPARDRASAAPASEDRPAEAARDGSGLSMCAAPFRSALLAVSRSASARRHLRRRRARESPDRRAAAAAARSPTRLLVVAPRPSVVMRISAASAASVQAARDGQRRPERSRRRRLARARTARHDPVAARAKALMVPSSSARPALERFGSRQPRDAVADRKRADGAGFDPGLHLGQGPPGRAGQFSRREDVRCFPAGVLHFRHCARSGTQGLRKRSADGRARELTEPAIG